MPDDGKRRRPGDETMSRIENLSSGWSLDPAPSPPPAEEAPRSKPRTVPPPPPGSKERAALEQVGELPRVNLSDVKPAPAAVGRQPSGPVRAKQPTAPPPVPLDRPKSKTGSVPISSRPAPEPVIPLDRPKRPTGAVPVERPRSPTGSVPVVPLDRPKRPTGAVPVSAPAVSNKSGSVAAIPGPVSPNKSGSVAAIPPPIPTNKSGSVAAISERLPLPPDRPPPSPSQPPPIPPRAAKPSKPPPLPVDDGETIPELGPRPAAVPDPRVPVGEFDAPLGGGESEKLRAAYAHATVKRDAAEALLSIPSPPATVVKPPPVEVLLSETAASLRGDPTGLDPMTAKFERGDPTIGERPDRTVISDPSPTRTPAGGTLRPSAALRRQRGIAGDVRYVFTALGGLRQSRKELAELEKKQQARQHERRRHLVTLGRTAVITDSFDHPALGKAREDLGAVEEERSQHAGAVAAAETELQRVRRDRDAKAKQYIADLAALDAELANIAKKLEPLEKEATGVKKKASELRDSIRRIEKQIADAQASQHSVKNISQDRGATLAEIATLKADLKSVQKDEPQLAGELDALMPRIAGLEAARSEAHRKKKDLETAELEDQKRTADLLDAIGAKRKVVDRAVADAEAARDKILFELGERLYVDRPPVLAAQLAPIDAIDLELGENDRRIMEVREILGNIDRAKLVRGSAVMVAALAVVTTFVVWVVVSLG